MMTKPYTTLLRPVLVSGIFLTALIFGCTDKAATETNTADPVQVGQSGAEFEKREVTFSVPDMTCPMCPITVRKALAGVDGVARAEASLDDKQARVVFDPAKTSIDALIAAVAEAGFTATADGEDGE